MRYRSIRRFVCIMITAILVYIPGVAVTAYTEEYRSAEEILMHKAEAEGYSDVQSFIDGWLTENAGSGSTEWYAMGISAAGNWDFSAYNGAIEEKLTESGLRATDYQRMALAYTYCGGSVADIGEIIDSTWNQLGIMSEIFSLILLESGEYSCTVSESEIISSLLSRQKSDGGWNLTGSYSDPDVTAMVLQSLAPFTADSYVSEAADRGIEVLSSMQQSDGGYKSYGTANSESCAQVIMALTQLGISPESDSRFIKNGNSVVTALMSFSSETGGFSHISGASENGMATVQAYNAMVSLENGGFYRIKEQVSDIPEETDEVSEAEVSEKKTEESTAISVPEKNTNINSEVSESSETNTASVQTEANKNSANTVAISAMQSGEESHTERKTETVKEASDTYYSDQTEIHSSEQIMEESVAEKSDNGQNKELSSSASTHTAESLSTTALLTSTSVSIASTVKTESSATESGLSEKVSTAVSVTGETLSEEKNGSGIGWKIPAYTIIGAVFIFTQLYLIARKQFTWKRLILTATVCGISSGAVHFINIQSPEEYYSRNISDVSEDSLTVEFSISCETIADELDGEWEIIPSTELVLINGETVFDILERVLAYNQIPFDYNGSGETIYIKGIDNIYEFDYGDMSGWMYRVNGEFPNVGCGAYYPKDGDVIEWLYTKNIGKDIGMEDEY